MNERRDTDKIKTSPSTYTCCKDSRPCPTVSQYVGCPGDLHEKSKPNVSYGDKLHEMSKPIF